MRLGRWGVWEKRPVALIVVLLPYSDKLELCRPKLLLI